MSRNVVQQKGDDVLSKTAIHFLQNQMKLMRTACNIDSQRSAMMRNVSQQKSDDVLSKASVTISSLAYIF